VPSIWWVRRDLRRHDNPALLAAAEQARAEGDDAVVALFVLDPRLWEPAGPVRRAWLLRSLSALSDSLDGRLLVRHGDPRVVVPEVADAAAARTVHVAADFGPYGAARDAAVEEVLARGGRTLVRTGSPYAVAPGRVRKEDGSAYRVYTPFYRAWLAHGWRAPAPDPDRWPDWLVEASGPLAPQPLPPEPPLAAELPPIGEAAALQRWERFREVGLADYRDLRDRADLDATTLLSAHLRWGEIHPRTVLDGLGDERGPEHLRKELAWREFYADVAHHAPGSTRDWWNPAFAAMRHDDGPEADRRFDAWCAGTTGYPFVDAGMRQLLDTGWMHNRVRMVVGSFLVKDLHLPWQRGAAWFMRHLRDGDLASNAHGWQWVAGSGTDAAPYFRVFNPVLQGRKFDPEGDYVRRYVPELRGIPGGAVHEPWTAPLLAPDYPERIVDHHEERDEALRRYAEITGR
jgi:deoxyribodipyrimidine photo-lyase